MWKSKKSKEQFAFNAEKVFLAAGQPLESVFNYFQTTPMGLTSEEVEKRQSLFGKNEVVHEKRKKPLIMFAKAFINPFVGVLTALVAISFVMDVLMASPGDQDWTSIAIVTTMIVLSAILRFSQEWKANRSSEALQKMVTNTCYVKRAGVPEGEISIGELVPGDIVMLAAGDMIPADLRIIESKDLFISQSSLTGESDSIEKSPKVMGKKYHKGSVVELDNICYMGSNVVSGSAKGIVFETGNNTYLGTIAKSIADHRAATAFDKGITKVSLLLIRFMLIMVPIVFLVNGITKGDWMEAFIFAISVAVGLTPEMLPMIVTANLSKGAMAMSRKKTIVKDLNAIQNFGAMNILCTDKTGTLTQDHIVLERHVNADGTEDKENRILRHAYFNSYFQTGLKNLMDRAVLSHVKELGLESLSNSYKKVDEIPFDFTRRRMSVVVEDNNGKRQIITKGAVEEMLGICTYAEFGGEVRPLAKDIRVKAQKFVEEMNNQGMRVLALAHKSFLSKENNFSVEDEQEMVLIGYLAFLDPPKESAAQAIRQLHEHGVEVKVLSGDNDAVVKTISRQVGIDTSTAVTGSELEKMSEEDKMKAVAKGNIFSKLTPMQKVEIIQLLQIQKNTVGFLGDGINDAAALRESDIGISVDSAVDIAKESADIILLEKDLMVLENGVIEGRKTFGNIIKYVKMTASSNFGNMFSVLAASAFLPFLPMLPIHILIQNLLYDISQTTIPFDRMDPEYLRKPRIWDSSDLSRFMIWIGPISSIFDIATYVVMWWFFSCQSPEAQSLFQSGWFIEGLLSQTLIVHMIRTRKVPFLQSTASWPVLLMTFSIMAVGIFVPFSSFGASIGLMPLPWAYFPWLVGILLTYCILTQGLKVLYIRAFQRWL
ncbi:magnesium-translocating P-type ATPase [Bacteroides sp.]|uniref:magnesium-translocating P-type ATPase n=1 Tax=Bacteroides sp. TaxID=29523 RepID=UPI00257B67AA|nr:magnesium-translocating P-type ATPase [Bacteroides sp.]MBE6279544.1 magnesium-translocating P-type ATPase [Bacteroides sp.]